MIAELNGTFLRGYDPGPPEGRRAVLRRRAELAAEPGLQAAHPELADPKRGGLVELILDASNLLPFHFLRTGDRIGRAVVKIRREDGASGTGFLVAPGILLTNHHVLPDEATAAGSIALANYEEFPPEDPSGAPAMVALDPAGLFVTDAGLDFAFCAVPDLDHIGVVPLDRAGMGLIASEFVNIVQHPRGRTKEVALQDNQVVKADRLVVQYTCDTEPGSSGSPVFNNQWKLVALHHASVVTDSPQGRSAGAMPGQRYLNEGIRVSAIAAWLESDADASRSGPVARLRTIFADRYGRSRPGNPIERANP